MSTPRLLAAAVAAVTLAACSVTTSAARQDTPTPAARPGTTSAPTTASEAALGGVYAALGDSYAAGQGVPPYRRDRPECRRSTAGYPDLVARALHPARLLVEACSGATTQTMAVTGDFGGRAQVSALPHDARLVTVTVGGNDINFVGIAAGCALADHCESQLAAGERHRLDALRPALTRLYAAVAAAAPHAEIVVVGYPRLFPTSPTVACSGFDLDEQRWADGVVAGLDAETRAAVAAVRSPRVTYVSTLDALRGHELCTTTGEAEVAPLTLVAADGALHPTAAGQRRLAGVVAAAVQRTAGR